MASGTFSERRPVGHSAGWRPEPHEHATMPPPRAVDHGYGPYGEPPVMIPFPPWGRAPDQVTIGKEANRLLRMLALELKARALADREWAARGGAPNGEVPDPGSGAIGGAAGSAAGGVG